MDAQQASETRGATMTSDPVKQWVRTELWDQVPVAISVIDRRFQIVEANRCFEEDRRAHV